MILEFIKEKIIEHQDSDLDPHELDGVAADIMNKFAEEIEHEMRSIDPPEDGFIELNTVNLMVTAMKIRIDDEIFESGKNR